MNTYYIIKQKEFRKIDFSEILETNYDTFNKSINGEKILISTNKETEPEFIKTLDFKEGPYTEKQISPLILTEEWIEFRSE